MSCYCPTCEDFVQPAEGGEAMSRIELYRRTKGYSIFGVVNAKMFSAAVILVVIALGLKNPQLILDSDILGPDNFRPAFMQKVGFYISDIAGAPSHYVLGYIE